MTCSSAARWLRAGSQTKSPVGASRRSGVPDARLPDRSRGAELIWRRSCLRSAPARQAAALRSGRTERISPSPFSARKRTLGITLAANDRLRSDEGEQKVMCEAVIFDCDGVLVDSEVLALEVELAALADFGLVYDPAEFKRRFMGMSDSTFFTALSADSLALRGEPLPETFPQLHANRYGAAMRERLIPTASPADSQGIPLARNF